MFHLTQCALFANSWFRESCLRQPISQRVCTSESIDLRETISQRMCSPEAQYGQLNSRTAASCRLQKAQRAEMSLTRKGNHLCIFTSTLACFYRAFSRLVVGTNNKIIEFFTEESIGLCKEQHHINVTLSRI